MHATFSRLVESYGYGVVFLFVGIESLGIPLPGETILVTAGALAALGHLSLWVVIAIAAAGAVLGDAGGYWIGRRGGLALVRRYGKVFHFDEQKLTRVRRFFVRHGAKTVFLGRFIAILRTWTAVLAGTAQMPYATFAFYNVMGGVTWAAAFGTLGYLFGRSLPLLERYIAQASLALVLLITLVVAVALGWRWFEANRTEIAERVSRYWGVFGDRHPRAARFLITRFMRGEILGLHLTIGFLISLAGLWLFAGITEDVINRDPLTRFDLATVIWIRAHTTAGGDRFFVLFTLLGSPLAMAVVALGGAALIAVRRQWLVFGAWAAAFSGASILSLILKGIIRRPRPTGAGAFLHGDSFSFPSGHALGSLVGYGMLAYVIGASRPGDAIAHRRLAIGAALLVGAIGISRLYLGVHYFSDVVGGYAVGLVWLAVCISGLQVAERYRSISA